MITEINDLERLFIPYESERVFVGPLLSLPISASYRYFHVAANGSKVYQSIGLGFVENESDAQKQRADIVEKLKSRFAELELFDSYAEMARVVHTHWPTEETARVLAAAEREVRGAFFPRQANYEKIDERSDEPTLQDQQNERLAAKGLPEPHQGAQRPRQASLTDDAASIAEQPWPITLNQEDQLAAEPATVPERTKLAGRESPKRKHPGCDDSGSIRLPPAALPPLLKKYGDLPASQKYRDLGLTQDDIASAILKLASRAQPPNYPEPPVEPSPSLPESPALSAADLAPSHPTSIPALAVKHTRGRSIALSFTAVIAAAMIALIVVLPSTRQDVNEVGYAISAQVAKLSSKSAAARPSLPLAQPADVSGHAPQLEAGPRTNGDANATPVSDQHAPIAHQARTGDPSEAKAIAKLASPGMDSLKSAVKPLGQQNEHSPVIKSPADATQETQLATLESGVAPISGLQVPAQGEGNIRHLDPDDIAALLSRGMDLLKSGDFASARLSLRRAAEAGNAEAALALGSTYDPLFLRQVRAGAIAADVTQARRWYEKALHFGSNAAAQRLARLPEPDSQSAARPTP